MFLKSLTLKGFKSFADPTTLVLEPGVTVVVGPNGSGKSNVVDAIAWVLGAQAPRSVRSQKMDDVIFAGTAKRPALGRAEVSLTIDNSAGLLGIELSEVTITRILFRTGDSEYAINGVPCRLLDVQELLSDAGVGRQQHVIVSQGQIDAVLNARPEDRRAIIEEAAGVLKYRKRKEKAERRLEATETNLLRVQDLVREVRRQLRPLERQAQAARRHGELSEELTALRIYVAGREIATLRARLEAIASARADAHRSEADLKAQLAQFDGDVVVLEAELRARGEQDLGDRLMRLEQLRERARGLAAVLTERRRAVDRAHERVLDDDVVATLESDAARLRSELDSVTAEEAELGPLIEVLEVDEAALVAERVALGAETDHDDTASRAASAAAEVRGELRSVQAGLARSEQEQRRARERAEQLERRRAELDRHAATLREQCAAAEAVEGPLVVQVERAEQRQIEAAATVEVAVERRQRASEEVSRCAARVEALQMALDASHARAGADRLAEVDGVLGTMLDLVEIDEGWGPAVEAALGDAVTAVVVDGSASARRAIAELRRSDLDGAVLALGIRRGVTRPPGTGEAVRPHVRTGRPGVSSLLDVLIGGAVRVADLDTAIDLAIDSPEALIVTPSGDRLGPSGWRIGTTTGGVTASALAEARAGHERAVGELAEADDALSMARAALADAHEVNHELARQLDDNDVRFTTAAEALARVLGERREVTVELDALRGGLEELERLILDERARMDELSGVLPALTAAEEAESETVRSRDRHRAELEARAAVVASRRRDLDVRRAALAERGQSLRQRLGELEQRLATDEEARRRAVDRRVELERSVLAVDRLVALVDRRRSTIEVEHATLLDQRRRQSEAVRSVTSRLEQLRRDRADAERHLDEVRERSRRADVDEAEAKLRLESAIDVLRRELDVEPAAAECAPVPVVADGSSPAARVRELERELRLLGPINPLALEEFTELQQRHEFLEGQLDDVRATRRELGRVISAVDAEIQQVFAGAYADVSANFSRLFTTLFPGGSGRLQLTAPDDLLSTGIEIEAKPSGKNVKKLSLLSGGERSLTALAFLFAVFRSRPSPFYVMDEVEAALDDVNLHRFLQLVAEFRSEAQLLIVSHQKRTMEAGDCLLGVTMQPGGSSKVVTERVSADV